MYDKSDPRSALNAKPAGSAPAPTAFAGPDLGFFYETAPQDDDDNGKTWFTRGQNFIVAYSQAKAGAVFERDSKDEYVLLLPDHNTPVTVEANGQTEHSGGYALIIMPPGKGKVTVEKGGQVIRLFSTQSADLNARCANAASYAEAHPNLPPFKAWPAPKDGFKIRQYTLDVPDEPGRFGRIWRCTTMMVNYLAPQNGPRDITKLSPHFHDDFEQCSLALEGSFTHHLRWPWTVNMNIWREDQHILCHSPSVTVIPPPAIHTSRGMDAGVNQLVDIFSPPRIDFSLKPGWVLNTDDYPMPSH